MPTENYQLPTDFEGWVKLKANLAEAMTKIDAAIAALAGGATPPGEMTPEAAETGESTTAVLISPAVLAAEIDRRIAAAAG